MATRLDDRAFARAEEIYQFKITKSARSLLDHAISVLTEESEEKWRLAGGKMNPERLSEVQRDVVNSMPLQLAIVARTTRDRTITAFVLLHSMSDILDRLCPFEKP